MTKTKTTSPIATMKTGTKTDTIMTAESVLLPLRAIGVLNSAVVNSTAAAVFKAKQ